MSITPRTLARVAGGLYLLVAVATGIAAATRNGIVVMGDPAATASHVRSSEGLFRIALVADLASATIFLITAMALFLLLRHVSAVAAGAMVTFVAVSVGIQALNLLNDVAALALATGQGPALGLAPTTSDGMVLFFASLQHEGFILSQVFFGLWLLPLGFLVVKSLLFPRVLGYLLVVACFAYLVDVVVWFLAPAAEPSVLPFVAIAGGVGELLFAGWLIVRAVPRVDLGRATAAQPA